MRILYFSRDYTPHDHRFLSALAQTEHEVFFLRLERGSRQLEDRPLPAAIEQVSWTGGQSVARWQDGFRLVMDLKRVVRQIKPDLIQAGPIQRSAFLAALIGFHPLVSMSWGYDLIWDANRGNLWRWATRFTLQHSDAMVGDCNLIRDLAVSYGMDPDRIVTFPWGIDLKHFSPGQPGDGLRHLSSFTLLSTRGWEAIYGVDVIARAFVAARRQRPELRLVLLGSGSQAQTLRQILGVGGASSDMFSFNDYQDAVVFPGQVGFADLPRFYRSADLYISASHSDGSSISLLEAMACGCPVLVSDIPGNREWVTQGEQGWLFPDGDADALAQAIIDAVDWRTSRWIYPPDASRQQDLDNKHLASSSLIPHPLSFPEMGACARKTVEERADWEKNFPQLLRAYEIASARN